MNEAVARPLNLFEYEQRATDQLAAFAYDYYASGAHDEITVAENRQAFERIRLRPHVMRDVSARDLSTRVLGRAHALPIVAAPMAFQRLAHPQGELALARATSGLGVTMTLSTLATTALEEVAAAAEVPGWFQLYVYRDRALTRDLVARAEASGFEALVLTVDAPLLGRRERDARNAFALPPGLVAANLPSEGLRHLEGAPGESGLFRYFASLMDAGLTWDDVAWLRSITTLPVVVKGVLRGDDAALAVEAGAAGIVVSNHGGRQLDTAVATIDALAEVVEAVDGRADVLLDGGVRRGTDVVKAVALGARAVMLGRPLLWGLAVDGEAGARHVLELLVAELDLALALCGARRLEDLSADLLR
ncbi:MAG: alpha-hydroxy-acid oxidizing protein [Dehalococcoidia bacterium]|nr:alpha-hydroxy-acid oxidizing protein [Dehalococcoidia bacterium]